MRHLYSVLERTSNFCFYNYNGRYTITGRFPSVNTLTLIRCANINNIVQSSVFPNLKMINYLSAPPTEPIYGCLSYKWIFPSLQHQFYTSMMEAGVGSVNEQLVTLYIDSIKQSEDGLKDISLYIPDYGVMNGDNYDDYVQHFFTKNRYKYNHIDEYYNRNLSKTFMGLILP